MIPAGMIGAGRRLWSHRRLASNLTSSPNRPLLRSEKTVEDVSGILPRTAQLSTQDISDNLPRPAQPPCPSTQVLGRIFASLSRPQANGGRRIDAAGPPTLVSQITKKFCTLAGDPSDKKPDNVESLLRRIKNQLDDMSKTVLRFEESYKDIRPLLAARCLLVPRGINHPSTAFLHSQTFKIVNQNASYISCFDVTAHKLFCDNDDDDDNDEKWDRFLSYLVQKRIFVVEDWLKSFSTIELLMYNHGVKQPDDGTQEQFYKGECDAAFDPVTQTADLSYIIWKDTEVIHTETFASVKCSSAVDGEIYAMMALLYKAEELKVRKLEIWSDSKTAASILSGELSVDMGHKQRDFFLMLRAMGARFRSLVVTWRPRELMVFADALAKSAKSGNKDIYTILRNILAKFSSHLRGSPVIRIERTRSTTTAVKKFGKVILDESYATGNSRYLIEVEEHLKFDCLVGLSQSLEPGRMELFFGHRGEDQLESLKNQLAVLDQDVKIFKTQTGACCHLTHKEAGSSSKRLVVVYDYTVPEDVYYAPDEFHVLLVTPSERQMMREEVEELTGLGFVYFNGVRLPVNDERGKKEDDKPESGTI